MLGLAALLAAVAGAAVTSPGPERVTVTVYRDPARGRNNAMNLRALGGFALVSETRRVRLPKGEATLRFEGVAGGIVPASAVIEGLPGGVIEKNRDARLLSPAALIDGTLGRRVTLRRTDRATGKVREEEATIIAGPAQGVVLRTSRGIEALRCSGLPETPLYAGIPPGLAAKPTLSVRVASPAARTATVTLSYLASEFDWSASYVATIAPDGETLDLFAWLTLANANAEPFRDAETQAVAGRLNRDYVGRIEAAAGALSLLCYPLGTTTSDLRPFGPPRYVPRGDEDEGDMIVLTARRGFAHLEMPIASPAPPPPPPPPEDLGDLKLYRVPERVTIAANAQKQVALLERRGVRFARVYRAALYPGAVVERMPANIVLRIRNDAANGLGIALPAGTTALYAPRGEQRLLAGLDAIGDIADGERFDLAAGISRQVRLTQAAESGRRMRVTATNANPFAVRLEVPIGGAGQPALTGSSAPLTRIDGIETWSVELPANGMATLLYG